MAFRTGLTLEQYYNLTPKEFYLYLKAYEENEFENVNMLITSSWYNEFFARQNKLKKLNEYLIKKNKNQIKNKMSEEEIKRHYQKKVVR